MMPTETLQCQHGHSFQREKQRGRKPLYCPEHMPEKVVHTASTETLECEHGHTFTRTRTRGKKPRYCPEHKPEQGEPRKVSVQKQNPRAAELLTNPTLPAETHRKLSYIAAQLSSGKRLQDDVDGLLESQNRIVREAERQIAK